ncbi:MAG: HAMP domain-containing histidine kinase [Campylobacter sp.]|nr:HAMP domain-containing histidine kinase [Campylobacter sp.]MBQ9875486.1 HAMP domain-containing histidine kinase [Campylobacter sp.]
MRRNSIFFTITFIFVLAIVAISIMFWWLIGYDKENYRRELNTRYEIVTNLYLYKMNNLISESEFKRQMQNFKIPEVQDEPTKNEVLTKSENLYEMATSLGSGAILYFEKKHYLKIERKNELILLYDSEYQPYRYDFFRLIYFAVLITLLVTYIFTIRKIKPLRKLKREINKFANGDLNIKDVSVGNNEISDVSKAFYDSVMQIKKLNESRHLFLRNIMHELKTPITKGRIATEMIEESKNKDRLISVFERLENLINEFAAVERATSGINLDNFIDCSIEDIVNEAIDLAMCDKERVNLENPLKLSINVDFKLFSIAVKNIIDNGLKYGSDKKIRIVANAKCLDFITNGEPLSKDFKFYIEPFAKGENAKQSFGLGLYIVDSILKAHGLELTYRHENGENIFSFENLHSITTLYNINL